MHKVMIYGTLRKGRENHYMWDSTAGEWTFIGTAKTSKKWPLVVDPLSSFPCLLDRQGEGHHVSGEIYEMDDEKLKIFDDFENHPDLYTRVKVDVQMDSASGSQNTHVTSCWIYMIMNPRAELMTLNMLSYYDASGPGCFEDSAQLSCEDELNNEDELAKKDLAKKDQHDID